MRSDNSPYNSEEANEDKGSALETLGKAAGKAVEVATVVGTWVVDVGLPQGIELYRTAREWLADDERKSAIASINLEGNQDDDAANSSGDQAGLEAKDTRWNNGGSRKSKEDQANNSGNEKG